MPKHLIFSCLGLTLVAFAQCQLLDVASCIGPLTVATACNSYLSILDHCSSYTGSQAASCLCPQTMLNAIAGCQNEFRICAESNEFDSEWTGTSGFYALWHSACDGFLTYSPTTPAITSLSITADPAYCLSAESYCTAFGALTDACTFSSANERQECLCAATVLDLASRCQVDGSISCLFRTPLTTNLYSYKYCAGSAMPQPRTTSVTSSLVVVTSDVSIVSSTASPSSTATNPAPSSTATSNGSPERHVQNVRTFTLASLLGGLAVCFVIFI